MLLGWLLSGITAFAGQAGCPKANRIWLAFLPGRNQLIFGWLSLWSSYPAFAADIWL
jgi:hypothetical protein